MPPLMLIIVSPPAAAFRHAASSRARQRRHLPPPPFLFADAEISSRRFDDFMATYITLYLHISDIFIIIDADY